MRHLFCISIIFFLLVGCQSAPKRDSDGLINIIPTKEKDRGPSREIDMSHVLHRGMAKNFMVITRLTVSAMICMP